MRLCRLIRREGEAEGDWTGHCGGARWGFDLKKKVEEFTHDDEEKEEE